MVISVTVLLVTGLYLNNPIYGFMGTPGMIRKIHSITGVVLIFVFFSQVYYYCYTGKFTEIVLLPRDIVFCRSFLRYYLFLTKQHPNFGRYNIGQKLIFSAWGAAVVVAGCTGVVLFLPETLEQLEWLFGGLMRIRMLHYFVAVFFLASIPLHLYLVFTEEPAKLQAMFTGFVQKNPSPKDGE